ncbi:MAG: hypothetical protein [Caudoviricetes sp.]|nr:MAG: hypothetical protein [Caudoviricetes sp.]
MATMYQIPLQQTPTQTLTVDLADGKTYDIELRTMLGNLYISIKKSGTYIIQNNICEDRNPVGRFVFVDLDGTSDPTYDKLNDRYVLAFVY